MEIYWFEDVGVLETTTTTKACRRLDDFPKKSVSRWFFSTTNPIGHLIPQRVLS